MTSAKGSHFNFFLAVADVFLRIKGIEFLRKEFLGEVSHHRDEAGAC